MGNLKKGGMKACHVFFDKNWNLRRYKRQHSSQENI